MTAEKARDLFSDYLEGALDAGLKAQFERALASDGALQEEYRQFEAVIRQFESLRDEEIPVPYGLHERIMGNLDRHLAEVKSRRSFWDVVNQFRMPLIGGVAVAAVAASLWAILPRTGPQPGPETVAQAGIGPEVRPPSFSVLLIDGTLHVRHDREAGAKVEIVREADGKVVQTFDVSKRSLDAPLRNTAEVAQTLSARAGGKTIVVALPGTGQTAPELEGKGTVIDLAAKVADAYRTVVFVEVPDATKKVGWTIDLRDPLAVKCEPPLSIERRDDGSLFLSE